MNAHDLKIDGTKIELHPERVAQWLSAKTLDEKMRVFPLYVEVSPVGHCQHRCIFCAVDYLEYKARSIKLDVMQNCILSMARNGVKSIMFAGEGEPLLHKQINEIVQFTCGAGIDVAFTTNGCLMNEKFIYETLAAITWIKISLNAGDAPTYAKVHQTKEQDYYTVWNNITHAVAHKEMNRLKTTLGIQTVVLPENYDTIEKLIIDARLAGVDYVVLKPYSQHHSSINKYNIDYKAWDDYLSTLDPEFSTDKFKVIYRKESALQTDRGYEKCFSTPNFWSYIMATGDVYSCSAYLLNEEFRMGNINEQSFEEIWLGEKRRKHLQFIENELDITECRKSCRMDHANRYLDQLKNPGDHQNFI